MIKANIKLPTIEAVKEFVGYTMSCPFETYIKAGRYVVDAKSIMGIFSLDLEDTITVCVECEDGEGADFIEQIAKFCVE